MIDEIDDVQDIAVSSLNGMYIRRNYPVSKCTIGIMRQITSPNQNFQEYFTIHYTEYMDFVLPGTDNRIKTD